MWEIFPDKIGGPEVTNEKKDTITSEKVIKSFCIVQVTLYAFSGGFGQDQPDDAAVTSTTHIPGVLRNKYWFLAHGTCPSEAVGGVTT